MAEPTPLKQVRQDAKAISAEIKQALAAKGGRS
jgi:hypothetical protein